MRLAVEQGPLSFSLVTLVTANRAQNRAFCWLNLGALTEQLALRPGRALELGPSVVPVTVESGGLSLDGRLRLGPARATVEPSGRVLLTRALSLEDAAGEALAELDQELELDLLGLGAPEPEVGVQRAEIVGFRPTPKMEGLAGAVLLNRPAWAVPEAPLRWKIGRP
jgi:hypothetical protein